MQRRLHPERLQPFCPVRDADGEHYFVRGVIVIPVHGHDAAFGIGAWVSQSRANYERYERNEEMQPTFGWLVNHLAHYDESTFLLEHAELSRREARVSTGAQREATRVVGSAAATARVALEHVCALFGLLRSTQ